MKNTTLVFDSKNIKVAQSEFFEELSTKESLALLIQISAGNIMIGIVASESQTLILVAQYKWKAAQRSTETSSVISFLLENITQFQNHHWKSVSVSVHTPKFTLIPGSLYDANEMQSYFSLNQPFQPHQEYIFEHYIKSKDIVIIFSVDILLIDSIKNIFTANKIEVFPLNSSLLSCVFQHSHLNLDKLYIHFDNQILTIIKINKDGLQFCNAYLATNAQDVLYYLLLVVEELGLNQHEIEPEFLSNFTETTDLQQTLLNYFKSIKLYTPQNKIKIGIEISQQFTTLNLNSLLSITLCQ